MMKGLPSPFITHVTYLHFSLDATASETAFLFDLLSVSVTFTVSFRTIRLIKRRMRYQWVDA